MSAMPNNSELSVEGTVSSKGQITLPREVRKRLGLRQGSRVRFRISPNGAASMEPVRFTIDDLWKLADAGGKAKRVMSFEEMNTAKARPRT